MNNLYASPVVNAHVDYGFTKLHGTRYNRSTRVTSNAIELDGLSTKMAIAYSAGEPIWNPPPKIHYTT